MAAGQGVVTSGPSGPWAGCFPSGYFRSQWPLGRVFHLWLLQVPVAAGWVWLLQVPVAAGQGVVTSGPSGRWAGCFTCGYFRSQWPLVTWLVAGLAFSTFI